ncbi:MAG: hypothetical protein VKL60_15025 [Sphaerospermopsis sp.]|nr:hypothetical protein [Sphaerospermopsis sp.]
MKRALLTVQGINNKQGYLYEEVSKATWLTEQYEFITDAQTDKYFSDKMKTSIAKGLNAITLNQWSRLGDVWYFFKNALAREQVAKAVGRRITILQDQGYEVDVIAHSLGNLITICSSDAERDLKVNNFYSLANPLFIKIRALRKGWFGLPGVLPYVAVNRNKFSAKKITALWSNSDLVAGKYDSASHNLLRNISDEEPELREISGTGHSTAKYLDYLETLMD